MVKCNIYAADALKWWKGGSWGGDHIHVYIYIYIYIYMYDILRIAYCILHIAYIYIHTQIHLHIQLRFTYITYIFVYLFVWRTNIDRCSAPPKGHPWQFLSDLVRSGKRFARQKWKTLIHGTKPPWYHGTDRDVDISNNVNVKNWYYTLLTSIFIGFSNMSKQKIKKNTLLFNSSGQISEALGQLHSVQGWIVAWAQI